MFTQQQGGKKTPTTSWKSNMTSISTVMKQLLTNKNQTNQVGHKHKETFSNKASCLLKWQRDMWLFPFRRVKKMLTAGCKRVHWFVRFCFCPDTSNSGHGYSLVLCPEVGWMQELTAFSLPHQPNKFKSERADRSLRKSQGPFSLEGPERTSSYYNKLWWNTAVPRQRRAVGLCYFWEESFCFSSLLKPYWYQEGTSSERSTWQEISETLMWCKSPQDRWYQVPIVPTNTTYPPQHPVCSYMAQFTKANFQWDNTGIGNLLHTATAFQSG